MPDSAPAIDQGPTGFRHWMSGLTIGSPRRIGDLTLVPLLHSSLPAAPDTLMDEAIGRGDFEIVEQGSGTVQRVVARNHGTTEVLVLEGDTLVGCKQNRMVAWSVMVGAGSTAPVSVGCMERGRWGHSGPAFIAGDIGVDPHIRRRSKRETSATLARLGGPHLDQGRAWADVSGKLHEWNVQSETDDYHTGLKARSREVRAKLRALQPLGTQIGVIAVHGDRLLGLEAVAHPRTWSVLARRALPAYLLGAASARLDPEFSRMPKGTPALWLEAVVRAATEARRALGKGYDMVIRGKGIIASCLWHEGAARHLAAFAT